MIQQTMFNQSLHFLKHKQELWHTHKDTKKLNKTFQTTPRKVEKRHMQHQWINGFPNYNYMSPVHHIRRWLSLLQLPVGPPRREVCTHAVLGIYRVPIHFWGRKLNPEIFYNVHWYSENILILVFLHDRCHCTFKKLTLMMAIRHFHLQHLKIYSEVIGTS